MKACIICCLLVVFIPGFIFVIWKLAQGRPIPQPSDTGMKLLAAEPELPNVCSSIDEPTSQSYVENNIKQLKLNQGSCDVRLVHGDWSVRAHKIILAAHSEVFEQLLTNVSTYAIPDRDFGTNNDGFPALLDFIYERKMPESNFVILKNLLIIAERYEVVALKCLLEKQLQLILDQSNVGNILATSMVANATYLKIAASQFLMDNLTPVSKTDTWRKVSRDNPSISSTAIETAAVYPKNTTKCHIECPSSDFNSAMIISRLKRFFIVEKFVDANLIVSNGTFKVNRAILVEQSDIWRGTLKQTSIELPFYTDPFSMKEFLIYMYSGWVPQLEVNTNSLLLLANEYEMRPLKNATETIIASRLNLSTFVGYLSLVDQAQSERLKKEMSDYFYEHRQEISQTDDWINMKQTQPEVLARILL